MIRWLQYSLFTPLFRNHSADGTREQELYQFSNVEAAGKMIQIRYSLIPYLYSEFLKAALNDEMMFKPLAFDFPDDAMAEQVEDQLLLGNELMIAQGAETYNTICDKSFDSDIVHISVLISTYPTPIIINKAPICVASEIAKSISLTP